MDIKNISLIESVLSLKKENKMHRIGKRHFDEVKLSALALKKSKDLSGSKIESIIKNTPDIRRDKVEEIKGKIKSDEYISNINHFDIADKLLSSPFGISFGTTKSVST